MYTAIYRMGWDEVSVSCYCRITNEKKSKDMVRMAEYHDVSISTVQE